VYSTVDSGLTITFIMDDVVSAPLHVRGHITSDATVPSVCVCLSVCVCVSLCVSVEHKRESRKTAEAIETRFGLWTRVGTRNHVL